MPPQMSMNTTEINTMRRVDSDMSIASSAAEAQSNAKDYRVRKSSLIGMINWGHVLGTHAPHLLVFGLVILFASIVHQVVVDLDSKVQHEGTDSLSLSLETIAAVVMAINELWVGLFFAVYDSHGWVLFSPVVKATALALVVAFWYVRRENPIYLMSFATFKAPDSWKVSHAQLIQMMRNQGTFTEESLQFMSRILERSGTGQATAWPPGIVQSLQPGVKADRSIEASRREAETVLFDVAEQAMKKAGVKPKDIDVLVINCSLFSPTPSLCAMVASHFKMRSDVATFNLSGMGCSASLISIDLAKQLLQARNGSSKALVLSTEIITPNLYHGNERGFLIQNTLFRCGGAGMVLSNSWMDGRRAWYKLLHTVRVQGTGPESYECVYELEDPNGERGVRLSKDIVKVAGKCMEKNMTMLGPLVLPYGEQAKVVVSVVARFICKKLGKMFKSKDGKTPAPWIPKLRPFVPDFKRGIDHFCIHAGGRAVIDGIEKNMKLELFHTEPSRMALLNYGNTSSSSIWYELEYIHEHQKSNPIKKGDRVMQVAFGSGFKCTSGVWLKL